MKIEEIVDKYYRRIFAYCLSILMNRERAEDACHDVFLKVHKNIEKLDVGKNTAGWLLSIARNHCYDLYQKEKRSFPRDNLQDILEDGAIGPEQQLLEKERMRIVMESLENLKPIYREVLVLRDIDNFTYKEIAMHLGIESKKVKWTLFKARKKMQVIIGDYDEKNSIQESQKGA
jgi:RNA polymerase sigma-70 factor, ECF subfamily